MYEQITARWFPAFPQAADQRFPDGQHYQIVNVPKPGSLVRVLCTFLECIEVMREEVVVEHVEQLPAVELNGIDQKQSVVGGRQSRLNDACRRSSSVPSEIVSRAIVV